MERLTKKMTCNVTLITQDSFKKRSYDYES